MLIIDKQKRILKCVGNTLNLDADKINGLSWDDSLATVGMDSLNCMEVVISLEQEFDVFFEDDELLFGNIDSINKLSAIIKEKKLHTV